MEDPLFILAPMDDVTDVVFRQIVDECAPADQYFTEFVNVDGLMSVGLPRLLKKLVTRPGEKLVVQIWGKTPANYAAVCKQLISGELLVEANESVGKPLTIEQAKEALIGIDINFGCPDKTVVKNGCCSALINDRELAVAIIQACKKAIGGKVQFSVKCRLGFDAVDLSWHELLLQQGIDMLTVHGRTTKQMSKVPADWDKIGDIACMRDKVAPGTKIIGNGDVVSRSQGQKLAEQHGLDGVMIGRGIFEDPFVFADPSPWPSKTRQERIDLYKRQVELFADTWQQAERRTPTLNKFCKIYINDFPNAKEARERLMACKTPAELLVALKHL